MGIIIDSNGATIDTQVANFQRMKDEILSNIDGNLSFESNTVAGVITNIIAFVERQLSEAVLNTRNQLNPLTAVGIALDILTIFYPEVSVIHEHTRSSYKNLKMFIIHMINLIRYFNKWGWFFDMDRKKINRKIETQYK